MHKNKRAHKDQSNKERNQRILHIYSTQASTSDPILKAATLPLKKNHKLSLHQAPAKSKELHKKQKNKCHTSTVKIKPPEIYERIAVNIANSNTNSQIEFSNYGETLKEGGKPFRKDLYIDCDQRTLMREIWGTDRKKTSRENEAATKIQKVFRGFMTRKLLQKYIEEYEDKLQSEIRQIKRKNTYLTNQEDSFYDCQLKHSYFLSNKKSKKKSRLFNSEEKSSNLEMESSILEQEGQTDNFISVQQSDLAEKLQKAERKSSYPERSCLTLNQSSIHQQAPQISLSFGYQMQHSPHFINPQPRQQIIPEERQITQSPNDRVIKPGQSEDNTRDGISQNLTVSPNYYQRNRSQKSESHLTSLLREQSQELTGQLSGKKIESLKNAEKAKWQQVIEFLSENIKENFNYQKTKQIMSAILQFSLKNREQLSEDSSLKHCKVTPTTLTNRNEGQLDLSKSQTDKNFKKKKWEEDIIIQKSIKNENMPLSKEHRGQRSIFDRTAQMKEYFLKNLYIEDGHIDKMMQFRETMLRKREGQSLRELNYLLENNLLTQDEFLDRLTKMTYSFHHQKRDIQQTRQDIYKGYKAQLQLLRSTVTDAKSLGFHIPFCRSMEIFPHHARWRFDDLMIDELNQMVSRKLDGKKQECLEVSKIRKFDTQQINRLMEEKQPEQKRESQLPKSAEREVFVESSSDEEQEQNFYEQTPIYGNYPFSEDRNEYEQQQLPVASPKKMRQASPFRKFSAVAVFETIEAYPSIEQDKPEPTYNELDIVTQPYKLDSCRQSLKREMYKLGGQSSEQEDDVILYKEREEKKAGQITDYTIKKIIWQLLQEICACPKLLKGFIPNSRRKGVEAIGPAEKIDFLQVCLKRLPDFESMKSRINQKMYPNIKELLFSMRDCDEEDDQSEYIEIGHYQYILNQEICFKLIEQYLEHYREQRKMQQAQRISFESSKEFKQEYLEFSTEKLRRLSFAQKLEAEKLTKHLEEYRQEVLRIELHMLFDVWNEQLIKYRENKSGYSGIGLNEITLSMVDRVCKDMKTEQEYHLMMALTQKEIQQKVRAEGENDLLYEDEDQKICRNNAQWILYTQEALQYGFDLARIVELELIFEFLNEASQIDEEFTGAKLAQSILQGEESESSLLNQQEECILQKKMLQMGQQGHSDSQDSFYS